MADTSNSPRGPRHLTVPQYVGLFFVLIVFLAVVGAGTEELGKMYWKEAGRWAAWAVSMLLLLAACWAINRRVANPTVTIVCAALVGVGSQKLGEELARPYGGAWTYVARSFAFFAGYVLWFAIAHRAGFNRTFPPRP